MNEDNIEVSDDFNFVNHNETDFSSFRRFRSNLDARYSAAAKERTKNYRVANYRVWRERMPLSMRKFNIRSFSQKVSDDIRSALKERKFRSFFLTGESRTGKTCLAYNLAGVLILRGLVKPSEIRFVTEAELLTAANSGFRSADELAAIMRPNCKLFVFDNVGTRDYDERRELPAISRFIEHVVNSGAQIIFTSTGPLEDFLELLGGTSRARVEELIGNCGVIELDENSKLE